LPGPTSHSGKMLNVLVLSAGRRVSLVQGFRAATRTGMRVLAADAAPELSAACHVSDGAFRLPRVSAPEYADALLELCNAENVGLVVPTIDTELKRLAEHRTAFERAGVMLLVCNEALVGVFSDKRETFKFFLSHGLEAAAIYPREEIRFPVFVKPFDGSLSIGAMLIRTPAELTPAIFENSRNIFCEYIDHSAYTEFTCDLYYDRSGRLISAVPRQRIEVRGGEVSKGRTIRGDVETIFFDRLNQLDGARGPLTVQLFRNNETGRLVFNEVNARFGGGYPLSRHAGADFQAWLIGEYLLGEVPRVCRDWKDGVLMLRYDAEVIVGA